MKKLLLICVLIFLSQCVNAQVVSIISIKQNNANGIPILLDSVRTVKGIVTASDQFGNPAYIQDTTGGIAIYDANFYTSVQLGDEVQVTATIAHYQGLIELTNVTYSTLSTGNPIQPEVITLSQIIGQSCTLEEFESAFIRINNVTIVGSGTFGSGVNYQISDSTGTDTLRIDNSTNLVGSIIPSGPFDLIGIVGQYVFNPPHCQGYQIMPRFIQDIIQSGGPIFTTNPLESNITPTSVTISWTTQNPGDSKVKYFVTDSVGHPVNYTDSVYNATQTTNHSLNLTNLRPGKIYYARAYSTNSGGTSIGNPLYFSTASNPSSTGAIEVYFNYPVDHSVALQNNNAVGGIDLKTRLLQRIDSADHSIDIALYSFNEINQIRDRLIIAITRGVKIRLVYDHRDGNPPQQLVLDLINAGVKVQRRPYVTTDSYIMHNKFFIFDSRDTTSYSDDWLWTGSANITNMQFYTDAQNVIYIQDQALCNAYTREFEEMWGSHTDNNNPSNAKFGSEKTDNTPHLFNINGKKVRCYFSPSDNVSVILEEAIDTETDKSINFCIYAFTRFQIANEMKGEYNPPTKMVRGVFDHGNLNGNVYLEMKGIGGQYPWNPAAKVYLETFTGSLHHKYLLIDADNIQSNPIVETGSYNYSNAGTFGNDENVLLIYDSLIVNQYYQEFVKRFTDAGGTIGVQQVSSEVPSEFKLSQNYPNPFNPETVINFDIPKNDFVLLKVFDITGRQVATLVNSKLSAGSYEVTFNGSSFGSGVYFYQLQSGGIIKTKKMILVK